MRTLLLLTFSFLAYAQAQVPNLKLGGQVALCNSGFRDRALFEAIADKSNRLLVLFDGDSEQDVFKEAFQQLEKWSYTRAQRYKVQIQEILQAPKVQNVDFVSTPDRWDSYDIPAGCQVHRVLMINSDPRPGEKRFLFNGNLWAQLSSRTKVFVLLEALFYNDMLNSKYRTEIKTLSNLRNLLIEIFAESTQMGIFNYLDLLKALPLDTVDLFGAELKHGSNNILATGKSWVLVGQTLIPIETCPETPYLAQTDLKIDYESGHNSYIEKVCNNEKVKLTLANQTQVVVWDRISLDSQGNLRSAVLRENAELIKPDGNKISCIGYSTRLSWGDLPLTEFYPNGTVKTCSVMPGTEVVTDSMAISYSLVSWNYENRIELKVGTLLNPQTNSGYMVLPYSEKIKWNDGTESDSALQISFSNYRKGNSDPNSSDYGDFIVKVKSGYLDDAAEDQDVSFFENGNYAKVILKKSRKVFLPGRTSYTVAAKGKCEGFLNRKKIDGVLKLFPNGTLREGILEHGGRFESSIHGRDVQVPKFSRAQFDEKGLLIKFTPICD